ncbi:metalloprotease family protein [bacterium]|nr:metalloprotease family protein [bacterium]
MIPGFVVALATFPGVIVHEFAHQFFCRIRRVAVFEVVYLRIGNPVGYVVHEIPKFPLDNIWIGIGPFFVNTIIGALIAFPSSIQVIQFHAGNFLDYFLVWLGVSVAMHAFPSTGDAKSIWESTWKSDVSWTVKAIAIPVVGLIYAGAAGSVIWLDMFYGFGVAMGIPNLLVMLLT